MSTMRVEEAVYLDDSFPKENVHANNTRKKENYVPCTETPQPWFRDVANLFAAEIEPHEFTGYKKKKILKDIRRYF